MKLLSLTHLILVNVLWYKTWWFYLIVALVAACILGILIVCVILCIRRSGDKGPKMQKIPPAGGAKKGKEVSVVKSAGKNIGGTNDRRRSALSWGLLVLFLISSVLVIL